MLEVIYIFDWYFVYYVDQIIDKINLMMVMQINKVYDGLFYLMKEVENGQFVLDFSYRYMVEDVLFGLVVMKGIGELVGVVIFVIDEIIMWV